MGVSVDLKASEGVCGMHASFGGIQRQSTELLANFWKESIFLVKIWFFKVIERPSLAGWIPATGGADASLWVSKHRKECAECMLLSVESNDRVLNCSPNFEGKKCSCWKDAGR